MSAVEAMAVSAAECEYGFSCTNLTVLDTRFVGNIDRVKSYYVSQTCSSASASVPTVALYVKSWLAKGHHAAIDINSIAHQDQQDDKETEISTTSACGSLSSRSCREKRPAA